MGQVNAWEGMPKPLRTHAFHFLTHSIHVEALSSSSRRTELSPSRWDVVSPFRHAQKLVGVLPSECTTMMDDLGVSKGPFVLLT